MNERNSGWSTGESEGERGVGTKGSIYLLIRNENNACMERNRVAKLVPLEGGKFRAKGEGESKFNRAKKDMLKYEQVFENSASYEAEEFVSRFLPYSKGLQKLEQEGYSVDFGILTSEDKQAEIVQKVVLYRSLLKKLAKTGVPFALLFRTNSGIEKKRLKRYKQLDKFERRFLRKHLSADYSTCRVYCFERGEDKSLYRQEFVYGSDKKKRQGLKYVISQVKERFRAGAMKRPFLLQVYCCHAWCSEWLWLSPKFLGRLAALGVDVEFNWYCCGFVRY